MNEGDKKRLFLAVNLSVPTTRKMADAVARMREAAQGMLRVAWVPPANLHVTLKFLGWARAGVVDAIADRVRAGVETRRAFDVQARGVGAFPSEAKARILWIGVADPTGGLATLAADVEAWMAGLGFAREARAFSPHVTVGRVKEGDGAEAVLAPHRQTDFGSSLVREVVLYESITKPSGSEYTALARMGLEVPPSRTERQTREVQDRSTESEDPDGTGQQPA